MQQSYCTVADAQFENVEGTASLLEILAASAVVQDKRGYPLLDPAHKLTFMCWGAASGPIIMPRPATRLSEVVLDGGDDQSADATLSGSQWGQVLRIDGEVANGRKAAITADWGDGRRGASITAPAALTAAAASVANPSSAPDWWTAGAMLVWDDELVRIDAVGASATTLKRGGNPVAHLASVSVHEVVVPEQLRLACAGMARRANWQATSVSTNDEERPRGITSQLDPLLDA